MKRKITAVLLSLLFLMLFAACGDQTTETSVMESILPQAEESSKGESSGEESSSIGTANAAMNYENATKINLADGNSTVEGSGATVNGDVITIKTAGVYLIGGSLSDGQIVVNTINTAEVGLILNGVDITCSNSAPLNIMQADATTITLAGGTENKLTDGTAYVFADGTDEPNAALFSKDDLTIDGTGSLVVNANYNNGIGSKDDLTINSGNITVHAADDGIVGRDALTINGGTITINAESNGLKSSNTDTDKGNITISGGEVNIESTGDGIQSVNAISISGGMFSVITGGGSASAAPKQGGMFDWDSSSDSSTSASAKGIKAAKSLLITGGEFSVDSADDTLHSNGSIVIKDGSFILSSGDDGVHADDQLTVDNVELLQVTTSYEGLEAYNISIFGGNIDVTASDDGINVSDPSTDAQYETAEAEENTTAANGIDVTVKVMAETTMLFGGFGGKGGGFGGVDADNGGMLTISGGKVRINAGGDGIDSNGSAEITGGEVIVDGPEDSGNGALDYNGTFNVNGGTFIAAGSSGMAEAPSDSSAQNSISMTFTSQVSTGSVVKLLDASGNEVLSYTAVKRVQNIILSSGEISSGNKYTIQVDGSQVTEVTTVEGVTYAGSSGGMNMGGPGGGRKI